MEENIKLDIDYSTNPSSMNSNAVWEVRIEPEVEYITFKDMTEKEQQEFLDREFYEGMKRDKLPHPEVQDIKFVNDLCIKWTAALDQEKLEKAKLVADRRADEIIVERNKTALIGVVIHYINVCGLSDTEAEAVIDRVKEQAKHVFQRMNPNYEKMFLPVLNGQTRVEFLKLG